MRNLKASAKGSETIKLNKKGKRKMKKFFKEFGAFIAQGNVLDLAIGVIIGAAFKDIVTSFTTNLIQPVLDLIVKTDIGARIKLKDGVYLNYGAFITAVINFVIMAFVVFLIVKTIRKATEVSAKLAHKKAEEAETAAPTTKVCPFCKSEIAIEATRCAHCTSVLED